MNFDFSAVKRAFQGMESRLASIRSELQQLQSRREAVRYAPAAKDDVKALVTKWIGDGSAAFAASVQEQVERMARNPTSMAKPDPLRHTLTFGAVGRGDEFGTTLALGPVLCAVIGPQVHQAAMQAIDAMAWPETALSAAQREKDLATLDNRIEKLLEEEREIVNRAREAGLNLE